MCFPHEEGSSTGISTLAERSLNIIIDDLDALEMIAPDGRQARVFMSKMIQSLNMNWKTSIRSNSSNNDNDSSNNDSGSNNNNISISSVTGRQNNFGDNSNNDGNNIESKSYNSITITNPTIENDSNNNIINVNLNSTNSSSSASNPIIPHTRILTLAAYGREAPTSSSSSSSQSFSSLKGNSNSFFPSAVHVSCLGSSRSSYEPSLSEYCRYR